MFVFFIVLYYLWAVASSVTCVTQLLFNYGHPESQLQLNYISVSCITIIITPKLTSEQQEGSLSDCVSPFPMKMSASPPVLIILEVAISRRRLEATNQAKWQFRVGHGAHGGRGRWEHGAGQGSQWQPIIDRFPKRILNPPSLHCCLLQGDGDVTVKAFLGVPSILVVIPLPQYDVQQYISLQKIWSHPVTCLLVPHQPKRVTAASNESESRPRVCTDWGVQMLSAL